MRQEDAPALVGGLCVILGTLPVLFLFDHFGKLALARPTLSAAIVTIAVAMRWQLRRHRWFWGTIIFVAALHIPLILLVPWTTRWIPVFLIIPIGFAELYVILWVVSLAERFMQEPSAAER
jgi:hypothetical protein